MVNCSKKRKAQCNGETCHWIIGKGCKRIRPIQEPLGCSRKRKAICMDSRHCHWIVGRGCKKNSHQPILPVRRRRQIPNAVLLGLLAAALYGAGRGRFPRSPSSNGHGSPPHPGSGASIQMSPLRSPPPRRSPSRSPPVSPPRRSPSRSPPVSPSIRRVRSLPIIYRRPRSPVGYPIRISPPSFPLTNLKKRSLGRAGLPWSWYPFAHRNYFVN